MRQHITEELVCGILSRMSFVRMVFIASAAFAILPLLGIPTSWKTSAQFVLAFILFAGAYKEYRRAKRAGEQENRLF